KLDSGLEYAFTPIYVIGILDFIMSDVLPNDRFMNSYSIRNDYQHEILLSDHLHYITIELPKFQKSLEELENSTDELAFIFNNIGKMNEIPAELRNKGFEKMFEMSKFAAMDEKEIIEYYARQKDIIDQRGALSSARRDGLEEGRAEGRAEQALSIARALKAEGVPISTIKRYTGLSEADILAL
ncbi:MAG: Rpn family recombination-promoting nuclease/putative transposase, partial [Bacteroidetes bacterium]|nr:Rpn family recombination-promoting nuclease/putative transposase [Candidatus Colenecus caballi]